MNIMQIAKTFNTTPECLASQYAINAAQLRAMAAKAEFTGRKVNGYTHAELVAQADKASARVTEALAACKAVAV